jgi:hypothetical protein
MGNRGIGTIRLQVPIACIGLFPRLFSSSYDLFLLRADLKRAALTLGGAIP